MPPTNPYRTSLPDDPSNDPEFEATSPSIAPAGSSGRAGFLRGIIGAIQRQRRQTRLDEERTQQDALNFLSSIPDTEQNTPIKANLALEILSQKPGSKGSWVQRAFGGQQRAGAYAAAIYSKIRQRIPQEQTGTSAPDRETSLMGQTSSGETISARPRRVSEPMVPSTVASPGPGELSPLGGTGPVGPGEILPTQNRPQMTRPRPPGSLTQFEFPEAGKYSLGNQTYQDESGNRFILKFNQRTGQPERVNLGPIKTTQELVEETKSITRAELARIAQAKGLMNVVLSKASENGIRPQDFYSLPIEAQTAYYKAAGVEIDQNSQVGRKLKQTQTDLNVARTAESEAKANFYNTQSRFGGITPAQALTDERARRQSANNYVQEFDALVRETQSAFEQWNRLRNPPEDIKDLTAIDPQYFSKVAQLEALFKSKLAAAEQKARQAAQAHPGLLLGGLGQKLSDGTQLPGLQISPKIGQMPRLEDLQMGGMGTGGGGFPEMGAPGGQTFDATGTPAPGSAPGPAPAPAPAPPSAPAPTSAPARPLVPPPPTGYGAGELDSLPMPARPPRPTGAPAPAPTARPTPPSRPQLTLLSPEQTRQARREAGLPERLPPRPPTSSTVASPGPQIISGRQARSAMGLPARPETGGVMSPEETRRAREALGLPARISDDPRAKTPVRATELKRPPKTPKRSKNQRTSR